MEKRDLMDFLQGASNGVAANITLPVDGIAYALRKVGVPVPAKPIGGSDWAADAGLTRDPQNKFMGDMGETLAMWAGPAKALPKQMNEARAAYQAEALRKRQ